MHTKLISVLEVATRPAVAIGGAVVLALLVIGGAWYLTNVSPSGAYATVVVAPLTEEVDVSGPVQSAETTDLSFQISGQVARISANVGDRVYAGQTLVALSGGAQAASLAIAEANQETAEANLASLTAGTRPEQLAINQRSLRAAMRSAYVTADSAVHATADQFFTNPRTSTAALSFTVPDASLNDVLVRERVALEPELAAWSTQVSSISFDTEDPAATAATEQQYLVQVNTFLDTAALALTKAQAASSLPSTTALGYESSIASARASVASALSALTSASGALTLAQAGATPQAIAIAQAQVDAARAAVAAARVTASETVLVAPISGIVTAQNAHLGQTVAPGVPLVSLIGASAFEAKAPVSENDMSKVKIGENVAVTFDAYPGQSFAAVVTAVDPAATLTAGVASYQVTVTFTKNDPRIVSGLTAHLSIITANVADVLGVPTSAVIRDGSSSFVYLRGAKGVMKTLVTTGITSASGMTQIISGISAGQEVLTFGNAN